MIIETRICQVVNGEIRADLPPIEVDRRIVTAAEQEIYTISEIMDIYARAMRRDGFNFHIMRTVQA